jgi:hypothetical protein
MSSIGNETKEGKARLKMLGLGDEVPNFTCETQVSSFHFVLLFCVYFLVDVQ